MGNPLDITGRCIVCGKRCESTGGCDCSAEDYNHVPLKRVWKKTLVDADELTALQARCDAATPGPWVDGDGISTGYGVWSNAPGIDPTADHVCDTDDADKGDRDAKFIAHARTDMPRLIAALRVAMKVLERHLNHHRSGCSDPVWGAPYHKPRVAELREDIARVTAIL